MRAKKNDSLRETLNVSEAALIAGCGEAAIRKAVANGTIPRLKLSRTIIIPRSAFLRWIESAGFQAAEQSRLVAKSAAAR